MTRPLSEQLKESFAPVKWYLLSLVMPRYVMRKRLQEFGQIEDIPDLFIPSMYLNDHFIYEIDRLIKNKMSPIPSDEILDVALSALLQEKEMGEKELSVLEMSGVDASTYGNCPSLKGFANNLWHQWEMPDVKYYMAFETKEDFEYNIQHVFKKHEKGMIAVYRVWDKKYFWDNTNGSHHFAALYRQCVDQDLDFRHIYRVIYNFLNPDSVRVITDRYYSLCMHKSVVRFIISLTLDLEFSYFVRDYAHSDYDWVLLFFDKESEKAQILYEVLKENLSSPKFLDLNGYFEDIVQQI